MKTEYTARNEMMFFSGMRMGGMSFPKDESGLKIEHCLLASSLDRKRQQHTKITTKNQQRKQG